jgi:hypothetical protein
MRYQNAIGIKAEQGVGGYSSLARRKPQRRRSARKMEQTPNERRLINKRHDGRVAVTRRFGMKTRLVALGAVLIGINGMAFGAEERAPEARATATAKKAVPDVILTEEHAGATITSEVGRTIEVRLRNEKEGAGWEPGAPAGSSENSQPAVPPISPSEITGKSVVRTTKTRRGNCDEFVPEQNAEANTTVGTYIYRYTCTSAGKSSIRLWHLFPSCPLRLPRAATAFLGEFVGEFVVTVDVRDKAPAVRSNPVDAKGGALGQ